jgi:hypothetical protein
VHQYDNENDESEDLEDVLLMGKISNGKYSLDYKYPISMVQSFAVGLFTYTWSKKIKK